MEENKELVIYGENGEIVECKFQRVDLEMPSTIMSYCGDIRGAIGDVLESTAQMTAQVEELEISEEALQQISNFDLSLDESEKSKKQNFLVRKTKSILGKLGVDAFKDVLKEDNYINRYKEYCTLLDKVAEAVEVQKQNTLNDIALKDNIIKEMKPLTEQLDIMIQVGLKDKEEYDRKTEELKLNSDPNDIDVQNQIKFRTQISAIFNNKLNELEKALVLYKEQIQAYRIQQNTDMELVMSNESYLQDSVPILKSQGSIMVENRIQSDRIARQQALDEATNNAILTNAKQLQTNAEAAVGLSINGRVGMATLEELDSAIRSGIQTFREGKKLKQQLNEKERQSLKKLNESLNQYNEELLNLVEDNEIISNSMQGQGNKRIGKKGVK